MDEPPTAADLVDGQGYHLDQLARAIVGSRGLGKIRLTDEKRQIWLRVKAIEWNPPPRRRTAVGIKVERPQAQRREGRIEDLLFLWHAWVCNLHFGRVRL